MSYHAEEAILDHIAASGPQSYYGCRNRVIDQVTIDATLQSTVRALSNLLVAGLIECDEDRDAPAYDLTDYGWNVMANPPAKRT